MSLDPKIQKVIDQLEPYRHEALFAVSVADDGRPLTKPRELHTLAIPRTTGELLYSLVLQYEARNIVEFGTGFGYSTLWLAAAARKTAGKIITFEQSKPKVEKAREFFKQAGVQRMITIEEGNALELFAEHEDPIDFLFLDGHKREYLEYLDLAEDHLNPGAVVVADNIGTASAKVQDFVQYVASSPSYIATLVPQDNGLLIAIKQ